MTGCAPILQHGHSPIRRFLPLIPLLLGYGIISTIALYPHTISIDGEGLFYDRRAPDVRFSAPRERHGRDASAFKDFSFRCRVMFYSTDHVQTVFQTADHWRGIRVEVNPPTSLRAIVGMCTNTWMNELVITEELRPNTWYDLAFSISKNKEIEVSFDDARFSLQRQPHVQYSMSHIVLGEMDGKIADMKIRYRFWNGLFPIETILIVFIMAMVSWCIRGRRFARDDTGCFVSGDDSLANNTSPVLPLSLAFFATLIALTLIAICIHYIFQFPSAPPPEGIRRDLLINLLPEPKERLQYVTLVLLSPFLSLCFCRLFRNTFLHASPTSNLLAASAGGLLILLVVFRGIEKVDFLYLGRAAAFVNPWYLLLGPALILFALHWNERWKRRSRNSWVYCRLFPALSGIFVGLLVLFTVVSSICDHNAFTHTVFHHFEAVFYPLSQVMQGKSLLIDFQNQYGLYPHFLEPIFRVFEPSATTFSLTMGLLSGTTLLLLYAALRRTLSHGLFAFLGIVVFFVYARLLPPAVPFDPYFQNMPIRTFFPVVLFFLTMFYLGRQSWRWRFVLFFAAGLGLLWNLEAGVVSLVSAIATLFYKDLCRLSLRVAMTALLGYLIMASFAVALVLAGFASFAFLRSSAWPDYGNFFTYQGIYYGSGYACVPMTLLHPWNALALIYLGAMVYAVHRRYEGNASLRTYAIVYFTILGCGIFSYYQGRSHDLNLMAVAYPAIFILLFLARELWVDVAGGKAFCFSRVLFFSLILVLFGYVLLAFVGSPDRISAELRRGIGALEHRWCTIDEDLQFIRARTQPGERIFIDSGKHMGVLYAETGTANPVDTPGFVEVVLQKDLDRNIDFLEENKSVKIFAHLQDLQYLRLLRRPLLYHVEGMSENSGMVLLRRLEFQNEEENKDANPSSFALLPPLPCRIDFSLEMDFTPYSTPRTDARIIGNGADAPGERGLFLIHKKKDEYVFEASTGEPRRMSSPFRMEPGRSHHVRIVCNRGKYHFYHDGRLIDSISIPKEPPGQRPLFIGHGAEKDRVFQGSISGLSLQVLTSTNLASQGE